MRTNALLTTLIDVKDSFLVVIDVQDAFVRILPEDEQGPLVERIVWLMRCAAHLDVPLIVTAEDIPTLGTVLPQVAQANDTPVHNKMVFGLADEPEILAAIVATKRTTAILVGLQTDVCVAHSALGLLKLGYGVAVVEDACGSPGTAHRFGLDRMRQAGIVLSSVKGLYHEWVRTVDQDNAFKAEMKGVLEAPAGVLF